MNQKELLVKLINDNNRLEHPIVSATVEFDGLRTVDQSLGTTAVRMSATEDNEHYKGNVVVNYTRLPITEITGVEVNFGETKENTVDPLYPYGFKVDVTSEEVIGLARTKFVDFLNSQLTANNLFHSVQSMDLAVEEVEDRARAGVFGPLCRLVLTIGEDNLVFLPGRYEVTAMGVSKEPGQTEEPVEPTPPVETPDEPAEPDPSDTTQPVEGENPPIDNTDPTEGETTPPDGSDNNGTGEVPADPNGGGEEQNPPSEGEEELPVDERLDISGEITINGF